MGMEQTSCFTQNKGDFDTEILKINYQRKYLTKQPSYSNKFRLKNLNNNKTMNIKENPNTEQINSSSSTHRSSTSPSKLINQNKIITIQKHVRLFLSKKKFKERIELLLNIIELDNTVNLIKDKSIALKILSENKGEQLWKELLSKKKIIPFEDTPYYRKNIKYYKPNRFLVSTQLIFIDKYKNNNLYKGTWTLEKVFNGFGTFYISGNKYEGFWNFGKLEGECRYFLQNNEYFIGNFSNGQAEGKGKYFHNDGTVYEGEWKNDQPSGNGKEIFVDGSVFEGIFENGLKKKGKFRWNDGSYYDGDIKNNLFEGFGVFHWKEGREYKGYWKGGKMWGNGIMKYIDGTRYEGNFENGKRDGYGKYIWNKNKYYEGNWKKGKQDGKGYFYNKGNGINAIWKEGNLLNNISDNSKLKEHKIATYNESVLSINKSNYSGIDKILLKIKSTNNYRNINYKLNDITKKKTNNFNSKEKNKKSKVNNRLNNKSTIINKVDNFSNIKKKINFYCIERDKRNFDSFKYNLTTNSNKNKGLNRISKDYSSSLTSDRNSKYKRKKNQTKKLNQTQDKLKINLNAFEKNDVI